MSLPTDSAGMELCARLEAEIARLREREAKLVRALERLVDTLDIAQSRGCNVFVLPIIYAVSEAREVLSDKEAKP